MLKKIIVLVFIVFACFAARAQTPSADSVYNQYLDFNLARFQGAQDQILEIGENLLPYADKLPEKARINFYCGVGKMYEDNDQHKKAIPYYEKVAAAVPDYYVAHRALGYLYLENAEAIEKRMNDTTNNAAAREQLAVDYKVEVKKALPNLEKAQACDPSDETLAIIKKLYSNINDKLGMDTLDTRLKKSAKHCIDILDDK